MKPPIPSREQLLENAFCDIPQKIGNFQLRPLSGKSFTTLASLGCPLIAGNNGLPISQNEMIEAVHLYTWFHSADIDIVAAIESAEDIPKIEVAKIGLQLAIGEIFAFLQRFEKSNLRLTAALAEIEEEDEPGKPEMDASRTGSHPSFSPSEPPEIPPGKDTSSGFCPSSEPSLTSMPQTPPMECPAAGPVISELPRLNPPPK